MRLANDVTLKHKNYEARQPNHYIDCAKDWAERLRNSFAPSPDYVAFQLTFISKFSLEVKRLRRAAVRLLKASRAALKDISNLLPTPHFS